MLLSLQIPKTIVEIESVGRYVSTDSHVSLDYWAENVTYG